MCYNKCINSFIFSMHADIQIDHFLCVWSFNSKRVHHIHINGIQQSSWSIFKIILLSTHNADQIDKKWFHKWGTRCDLLSQKIQCLPAFSWEWISQNVQETSWREQCKDFAIILIPFEVDFMPLYIYMRQHLVPWYYSMLQIYIWLIECYKKHCLNCFWIEMALFRVVEIVSQLPDILAYFQHSCLAPMYFVYSLVSIYWAFSRFIGQCLWLAVFTLLVLFHLTCCM